MISQRPISPLELGYFSPEAYLGSVPVGGMPLFIGSTIEGELDLEALRAVLEELVAVHPLLGCRRIHDNGVPMLRLVDGYRPPLQVAEGGEAAYLRLVNRPQDWDGGLFRAVVLRDESRTCVVLVIHHGISDGRSAFALLGEMWWRYTARLEGAPLPILSVTRELPAAVDDRPAETISESEVLDLLDTMRGMLAEPPHTLSRIALSNIGRIPAHSVPAGVRIVRDDICAMVPGCPRSSRSSPSPAASPSRSSTTPPITAGTRWTGCAESSLLTWWRRR
ncbi:condensation domain-containing protein [Nocardia transvalensis]|uniref:condensation domain-containing protein n=1 Tax=Nocardia transvalensis TaxID=37333 RepID=UPI0018956A00|nr:condensation domain-containing protein [Nocardia transvalensis]MBF6333819.1 hypothetical protein [Nocardia transvalensis]